MIEGDPYDEAVLRDLMGALARSERSALGLCDRSYSVLSWLQEIAVHGPDWSPLSAPQMCAAKAVDSSGASAGSV